MKTFTLMIFCLIVVNVGGIAQNVVDTHPTAIIYAIDYSTGQEVPATSDQAISFKNSFIDLVTNTPNYKQKLIGVVPGRKTFVVTQMNPQSGNAYQLVLQSKFLNQINTIYTFVYNVDDNSLSYFNTQSGSYVLVAINGLNLNNLNNCSVYGKFNIQQQQSTSPPVPSMQTANATAAVGTDVNTPIDADVTANTMPPVLPDYEQPECPEEGFLWQPGFWSFNAANGYYWVPGAWVAPPNPGLLWTPPYWGYEGSLYIFHAGYWGNTVGFYGGINYGFGYGGAGFVGGEWRDGYFRYNSAVLRIGPGFHNRYEDRTVVFVGERNHAAFNGRGGIVARPSERERAAMHERHIMATPEQNRHQLAARIDRNQFAKENGGRPSTFASQRTLDTKQPGGTRPMYDRPGINGGQGARQGMPGTNNRNATMQGGRPGIPTPTAPGAANGANGRPGVPVAPNAMVAKQGVPAVPGGYSGAKPGVTGVPSQTTGVSKTIPKGKKAKTPPPITKPKT